MAKGKKGNNGAQAKVSSDARYAHSTAALSIETPPPIHLSSVSHRALRERSPSPPRDNDDIHGVAAQVGDTVRRMMPLSAPKVAFESAHRAHHYTEEEWKKITVRLFVLCWG